MTLIERHEEAASLCELFNICTAGNGAVALITGNAASGKSSLLQDFGENVSTSDAVLLTAVASRAERDLPMGVLSQLLHSTDMPAERSALFDHLLEDCMASLVDVDGGLRSPNVLVLHGLFKALIRQAMHTPVVIVVDDLQYIDNASWQFLLYFLRRSRSARTMVVFTQRTDADRAPVEVHSELVSMPNYRHIELQPLTRQGTASVLSLHLDPETADQLVDEFHRISHGNPLLVQALLDDLSAGAPSAPQVVVGDAVGRAVLRCLHSSGRSTLRVARGAAVLNERTSPVLLARLLDMETGAVEQECRTLRSIGLLGGMVLRHATGRSAVVRDMPTSERSELHRRAAKLLFETCSAATTVARHLLAAGNPDEPWAVEVLTDAADHTAHDGEVEFARSCLELAQQYCFDRRRCTTITLALLNLEWPLHPTVAIRRLRQLVDSAPYQSLLLPQATDLVDWLLCVGWTGPVWAVLDRIAELSAAGDAYATTELRNIELRLSCDFPGVSDRRNGTLAAQHITKTIKASAVTNPRLSAFAAFDTVLREGEEEDSIKVAEKVLEGTSSDDRRVQHVFAAISTLLCTDRLEKAGKWTEKLLRQVPPLQCPGYEGALLALRAETFLYRGDFRSAHDYAHASFQRIPFVAWGDMIGGPLSTLLLASVKNAELWKATELIGKPVSERIYQTRYGIRYLYSRGQYYFETGRLSEALTDFNTCGEMMRAWDMDRPAFVPWRSGLARVRLCLNQPVQAWQLLQEQLELLPDRSKPCPRVRSPRPLAAEDRSQQYESLHRAIVALEIGGDRAEPAQETTEPRQLRVSGDESERAATFRHRPHNRTLGHRIPGMSLETPEEIHTDTAAMLRTSNVASKVRSLSGAERRTGTLAAQGLSNREISERLYITVSTVEQHLTRVYRKLDIKRRQDLPSNIGIT
ncbi:helix-turn-helix transcriptional regulator [Haloactinomyces albus]|uniref:DNA-binding CsgD family transcriptional regulator/tetratricopeptide (TPR) repeat protein n=1 Tax=Haloactinomyces albus TaxID=1352928 RepID=A0AAE3ZEZ5_9ACTN|nr:AAA family ATPase [Haloactinomyces albus]MDR7303677.1 DNA-binding CsgD family transcriptional regulator/tetratricopeptide (TPR) repeat protein [Haloactinomyces albus]